MFVNQVSQLMTYNINSILCTCRRNVFNYLDQAAPNCYKPIKFIIFISKWTFLKSNHQLPKTGHTNVSLKSVEFRPNCESQAHTCEFQ